MAQQDAPFWTRRAWTDAGARLHEAVVHDPCRGRRFRIFITAEVTMLLTLEAVDCFAKLYRLPLHLWSNADNGNLLLVPFYFFPLSYALTPVLVALSEARVQKVALLELLLLLAILVPTFVVGWMVNFFELYPHLPFLVPLAHAILRIGMTGLCTLFFAWLGVAYLFLRWLKGRLFPPATN